MAKRDLVLFYILKIEPLDSSPEIKKYPKKIWSDNPPNSINYLLQMDKKRKEKNSKPQIIKGNYKISIINLKNELKYIFDVKQGKDTVDIIKDGISKPSKEEIEIAKDQLRQEGKPEAMLDKIAAGKIKRFFKDNTLVNQDFIKDSKVSVAKYVKSIGDVEVVGFKRVALG